MLALLTLQKLLSRHNDCQESLVNCQLSKFPVASNFQSIMQKSFYPLIAKYVFFHAGFGPGVYEYM